MNLISHQTVDEFNARMVELGCVPPLDIVTRLAYYNRICEGQWFVLNRKGRFNLSGELIDCSFVESEAVRWETILAKIGITR